MEPVACCSCGINSQGTHRRRRPPLHRAPRSRSGSARASGSAAVRRPLPPRCGGRFRRCPVGGSPATCGSGAAASAAAPTAPASAGRDGGAAASREVGRSEGRCREWGGEWRFEARNHLSIWGRRERRQQDVLESRRRTAAARRYGFAGGGAGDACSVRLEGGLPW